MPELQPGDRAPSFDVVDHDARPVSLKDLRGTRTILYFFPKADTSGWTIEARQFDEHRAEFEKRKIRIVGISPDPPDALKRFREKYDLHFTFLSDPDHGVLEQYGAWGDRPGRGPGVIRSTVLIGPEGSVDRAWYRVTADGHAANVLEMLDAEAAGSR